MVRVTISRRDTADTAITAELLISLHVLHCLTVIPLHIHNYMNEKFFELTYRDRRKSTGNKLG